MLWQGYTFVITLLVALSKFGVGDVYASNIYISTGTDFFVSKPYSSFTVDRYINFKRKPSTLSLNVSYNVHNRYYVGLRTNRLINTSVTQGITINGSRATLKTKSFSDSVYIAYDLHNKHIFPFAIITRLNTLAEVGRNQNISTSHAVDSLIGLGVSIPIHNKVSLSFTYYNTCNSKTLKKLYGISVNYVIYRI